MNTFERFCKEFPFDGTRKAEQARAFLWFLSRSNDMEDVDLSMVADLFERAALPKPSISRLREYFVSDRRVHKGSKAGTVRLLRNAQEQYDNEYNHIFAPDDEISVSVKANVRQAPLLSTEEIDHAFEMAQLYVVLHCYENSVRRIIQKVLSARLGSDWWKQASNAQLRRKLDDRKRREKVNRWLSPRGDSPLYYLDWGDLLTLVRKHESDFQPFIQDLKFAELRFEELERLRNIVAHHGYLPNEEDYQRVIISFRDWCMQVTPSIQIDK